MAGIGSTVDLMLFYTLERVLFSRMVGLMGIGSLLAKEAIALWLVLEEMGYRDLIRLISSFDNEIIISLSVEALRCVKCIQLDAIKHEEFNDSLVFIGLYDEPMNLRFFYDNRELLYRRFSHVMVTVCQRIFGNISALEVNEFTTSSLLPIHYLDVTGMSPSSSIKMNGTPLQQTEAKERPSNLNPHAAEFNPRHTLDDSRTLFLTFSAGHPLSRDEIIHFFNWKWGQVLEEVVIEQSRRTRQPLYGRAVLTTSSVIPSILKGQSTAKFIVNRKHLWVRVYVPRYPIIGRY